MNRHLTITRQGRCMCYKKKFASDLSIAFSVVRAFLQKLHTHSDLRVVLVRPGSIRTSASDLFSSFVPVSLDE